MIKKWVLKAIVQKVISFLPFKHQINFLFQKYVTKGVYLGDQYFEDKLVHFKHHWNAWLQFRKEEVPKEMLELGTGWYPVIPILFYLKGAEKVITLDIAALMDKEKVVTAVERILDSHQKGELAQYIGDIDVQRIQNLEIIKTNQTLDLSEILEMLHINYLIADARNLDLSNGLLDMIVSNNVFEHIYPDILKDILKEFKRLLKPTGVMSHFIDMTDHFAHLDKTISVYNYLKFSSQQWKWIDNSVQPQSRLRLPQYLTLYKELEIPVNDTINASDDLGRLKELKVDQQFKAMTLEELGIIHSYVISHTA